MRKNIYSVFKLAQKDGLNFKVTYRDNVYLVNILRTGEKYNTRKDMRTRKATAKKAGLVMSLNTCPECQSVQIGKICVSQSCTTNAKKVVPQL